jgi:hypothetical protein
MSFKFTYTPDPEGVAVTQAFESHGVDCEPYNLINNYGWTATTPSGHRIDLRHVLNVYGADVDYYSVTTWTPGGPMLEHQSYDDLKTVLKYLNALLETLTA